MAEEKILLDVDIRSTDALNKLEALRKQSEQLRAEEVQLAEANKLTAKEYIAYEEKIKAVNSEMREQSKVIQNAIKDQNAQRGSLTQMSKELTALKKQYRDLSEEQRNSPMGQEMVKKMNTLNDALKKAEESYGQYGRNVGNYTKSFEASFGSLQGVLNNFGGNLVNALKGGSTGLKAFGVQMGAVGKTMLTTPVGWLVMGLNTLTNLFSSLKEHIKKNDDASTSLSRLWASFQPLMDAMAKGMEKVSNVIGKVADKMANFLAKHSEEIRARQAIVTAIDAQEDAERAYAENSAEREKEIARLRSEATDKTIYSAKERMKMMQQADDLERANMEEKKILIANNLNVLEETAARERDTSDETKNKIAAARAELTKAEQEYYTGIKRLKQQGIAAEQEYQKEMYSAAMKQLENTKTLADENAKQQETAAAGNFYTLTEFKRKEYDRVEEYERQKLELQKQYGQITAAEYDNALTLISARRATFEQQQVQSIIQHNESVTDAIKTILTDAQTLEEEQTAEKYDKQIQQIQEYGAYLAAEYDNLYATIQAKGDEATDDERARLEELSNSLIQQADATLALEDQKQTELSAIRQKYKDKDATDQLKALDEQYKMELLEYSDNEAAKLETTREYAEKRMEILAALYGEESLQYKEAAAALKKAMDDVNKHNEGSSAAASQKIADEYAKIGDTISEWGGKATEMFTAIDDLMTTKEDAQLERYKADNEERKASLQEQLDAGIISQDEYNARVKEMDASLDKQKAETEQKQAKRQKALAIMQASINLAASIMKIWAEVPKFDFGATTIAMTAAIAAIGAVQIAAIAAQPLPKAARGMLVGSPASELRTPNSIPLAKAANGGYLTGNSHAQGGIPIEAEGGEIIINKRSAAMYRPLLSQINAAGGGVRFAAGGIVGSISDGGTAARAAALQGFDISKDLQALGNRIENMRIYTAVEDINRGQGHYAQVTSAGIL